MIEIKKHPKRSRKALLICDDCEQIAREAYDVTSSIKKSHGLLLCKECVKKMGV